MNNHEHQKVNKVIQCIHKIKYCKTCDTYQCQKCGTEYVQKAVSIPSQWICRTGTSTTITSPWQVTDVIYYNT